MIGGSLCKNLSIVCILLDQNEEALEWSKKAIQYLPQNPLFWFRHGEIYYQFALDTQKRKNTSTMVKNSFCDKPIAVHKGKEKYPLQYHFFLKLRFIKNMNHRNALYAFSTVIDISSTVN